MRRRKPSAAARMRRFWMPITMGVAVTAAALIFAATWPGFTVEAVQVVGNDRVSNHEILADAAIALHRSLWMQNTVAIERRVAAIPYVRGVSIYRVPPKTIRIEVRERMPFATLRSEPASVIVDRELRVLEPESAQQEPVLIVRPGITLTPGEFVTAHEAIGLRDAYDALHARHIDARTLAWDRYGGLVVTLPDALTLLLGPANDLAPKLRLVDAILAQVVHNAPHQKRVAVIDVRAPSTPVVVYR